MRKTDKIQHSFDFFGFAAGAKRAQAALKLQINKNLKIIVRIPINSYVYRT